MSTELIIYGCIEAMSGPDESVMKRNREQIESLPMTHEDVEDWQSGAIITRHFFAFPAEDETFFTHIIHFGGSYRIGSDRQWVDWLTEFERIIKGMYWIHVTLHVTGEVPDAHYGWHIAENTLEAIWEDTTPVMEWNFSGGSRTSLWDNAKDNKDS